MVPPESATYHSPSDRAVENIALPLDHIGLNKYHRRDNNYNIVKDKLNELIASPMALQEAHLYLVPLRPTPYYVDRPNLAEELQRKLRIRKSNAQVPYAVAIQGLGGTGKSQLALHYIEHHKHEYDTVFWIDAGNEDSMRRSFLEFTRRLILQSEQSFIQQPQSSDAVSVTFVLKWFEKRVDPNQKWLVVIDNADDVRWGIKNSIPRGLRGTIIITSQDSRAKELIDGPCEAIEVNTMNDAEAESVILKSLELRPDSITDQVLQSCGPLIERLGGLPIALGLASAVIRNYNMRPTEALDNYIQIFDEFRDEILKDESSSGLSSTQKTVWTVWNTALHNIDSYVYDPKPSFLLAFLAHFRGSIVQDNIFRFASLELHHKPNEPGREVSLPPELQILFTVKNEEWKSFYYKRAIDTLARYHLLERVDGEEAGITMHGLVKWRARLHIPDQPWSRWNLEVLASAMDFAQVPGLKISSAWYLTDHLNIVEEVLDTHCFSWRDITSFRLKFARYYLSVGEYSKSESILLPAVLIFQKEIQYTQAVIDQSDIECYIASLSLLSSVYRGLMDLPQSEKMGLAALEMQKRMGGTNEYLKYQLLNNLAVTYESLGEYNHALNLQAQALKIEAGLAQEGGFDSPTPDIDKLTLKSNMAMNFLHLGQLQEALVHIISGLAESRRLHGEEHVLTFRFLHLLGVFYHRRGGLQKEAEELLETTLSAAKRKLGPQSPLTMHVMTSLALAYRDHNQHVKAANILPFIVQVEEREKGFEHPDTLSWTQSLGDVLLRLDRSQEAVRILGPALSAAKQAYGVKNAITVGLLKFQSVALMEQGSGDMMIELLNSKSGVFKFVWGLDKATPVDIMLTIYHEHIKNDRFHQAETLIAQTTEVSRKAFGTDHEKTLYSIYMLMQVRIIVNKSFLVLDLGKEAVEISQRINGQNHRSTLVLTNTLRKAYRMRHLGPGAIVLPKCPIIS